MNSFRKKSLVIPLLFCILIGCLAAHFIIEDTLFIKMFASFDSIPDGSFSENFGEFEHLDDLVYAENQPVHVAGDNGPEAFSWAALSGEQAYLPIFKPPKI